MGISQPCVVVDGQFPGLTPGPDTRISLLRRPSMFGERAVLLSPLVGSSLHTVYGPCIPAVSYRLSLCVTSDLV
jgi:hypothetical protein